jgi:hypothetical protein
MAARKRKKKRRYHTGIHVSPKTGQECHYRSGWEFEYMQWLDANPDIVGYRYEDVVISYVSNVKSKRIRHYWPDFLVQQRDGQQLLVEIKPKRKLDQDRVQKKLKAAALWCQAHQVTLVVLTEKELKLLGLLK